MERQFIVRTAGFSREAAEPTHERHLIVSRNLGKQKAILGRCGRGCPQLSTARGGSAVCRGGKCFLSFLTGGRKRRFGIYQNVIAAKRTLEVTSDERLGDWASIVGRYVQLRGERVHEAAGAGRGVASPHVAQARRARRELLVVQVVDEQSNLSGVLSLDHPELRTDFLQDVAFEREQEEIVGSAEPQVEQPARATDVVA